MEAPYQLGKVERHGDIWKKVAGRVVQNKSVQGFAAMRRLAGEVNATINEMSRVGGFSPAQWVMGRTPRYSAGEQGSDETAGQFSSIQEKVDPTTIFGERIAIRHEAKKAYVLADSSEKVAKAILRKTAPNFG